MTTRRNDDNPDDLDGELLGRLVQALPGDAPSAALKDRLFRSIDDASLGRRFERFAERVAALADVTVEKAQALLDAIDETASWLLAPEMSVYNFSGGARVQNAITGFVRIPAGRGFPEHEHVGDEVVLVLQGVMLDSSGAAYRAGDEVPMKAGTTHSFVAGEGPDLLYLGIIQGGMKIGESLIGPEDPRY